jgi:hypothetical protein
MNRAGCSELAVDVRITAFKAAVALVDVVFHALVGCFSIGVVDAFAHGLSFFNAGSTVCILITLENIPN